MTSFVDAVDLLQYFFGKNKRMLILVDEISKANDAPTVMEEISVILNMYKDIDFVGSALSPKYIHKLVIGSQRDVIYCPSNKASFV